MTFYMCYARSRPNLIPRVASGDYDIRVRNGEVELVEADHRGMPILTNAVYRWSDAKDAFLDPFTYETERVIDSGGYNVQAQFADRSGSLKDDIGWNDVYDAHDGRPFYPWSVEEYHNWLAENHNEFEWAAVMDYACEERFDILWPYTDRIGETVENTVRQFELLDGEYKLLPVLQGLSADEYIECYDRLKERGVPVKEVGLGTVCRISSTNKIIELENELRSRRDFDHIHGFGVKRDSFSMGARFESADTQAWVWMPSHGKEVIVMDGKLIKQPCDNSRRRTSVSFREYYRYVQMLREGESELPPLDIDEHPDQTTLHAFDGVVA